VTERPIDQQVSLREERVDVERRPVDRALNTNDLDAFKEGEIELTETAERLRVDKEARVVEEVMVRQNADTHTEEVHETARRRDVEVERDHDSMDTDTSLNMNRTSDRDDLRPHR
jgi:stress response protein YsnF